MLISVDRNEIAKAGGDEVAGASETDRRGDRRFTATYRPCCIIVGKRATMGLLRNFSAGGACIETDLPLQVGDVITYFWESKLNITARIAWSDEGLYGLEHIAEIEQEDMQFPARSVRVPCQADAVCWINGDRFSAKVENVSLGGIRLTGLPELPFGALMTVCFCGLEVEAATARWSRQGAVGARFRERLTRRQLAELLLSEEFSFTEIEFEG